MTRRRIVIAPKSETATFEGTRDDLVLEHLGGWVMVKGDGLVGLDASDPGQYA